MSFTLECNIAHYFGRFNFESDKKIRKKWLLSKELVYGSDTTELIYKINFQPRDSTVWGEKGCFYISSKDFRIYRFEIYVKEGVYNENMLRGDYYVNYNPYNIVVIYNKSLSDRMELSYIRYFVRIETMSKTMKLIEWQIADCELFVVSSEDEYLEKFNATPVKNNKDIFLQKENLNPDFWLHFNIPSHIKH